jgi:hypothetical protein
VFWGVWEGIGKMVIFCKFILDGKRQIGLFMFMGGKKMKEAVGL